MATVQREKSKLFTPLPLADGTITLKHRIVMAPLTRQRSPNHVPTDLVGEYYEQRASQGGLLISEGTLISPMAGSYPNVPGIWTEEQVEAWKPIVQRVHAKGGIFFCQLWHVGRCTSPEVLPNGRLPLSSTTKTLEGRNLGGEYTATKAMDEQDMKDTLAEWSHAAKMARKAGFDGVEIHGANGYLLDQFLHDNINDRTDEYGGSIENRSRFPLQIVNAVISAIGANRTGLRLAPFGLFQGTNDSNPVPHWSYFCRQLRPLNLAYVHIIEPREDLFKSEEEKIKILNERARKSGTDIKDWMSLASFRRELGGQDGIALFSAGGYNFDNPFETVEKGEVDAVVYGRYFISNPDLPRRIKEGIPLTKYDRSTFYSHGREGYVDYGFAPQAKA